MLLDFRKAPKGGRTDFSRSHLTYSDSSPLPQGFVHGIPPAWRCSSGWNSGEQPSQVFLPFSIQSGNCSSLCPSPVRRSTGKAAGQSHSLNHPQVVQCCVHKILPSNSLFPFKLRSYKSKARERGLHKGASRLQGPGLTAHCGVSEGGERDARLRRRLLHSSQKVLCSNAERGCSCLIFIPFMLPELEIFFFPCEFPDF